MSEPDIALVVCDATAPRVRNDDAMGPADALETCELRVVLQQHSFAQSLALSNATSGEIS